MSDNAIAEIRVKSSAETEIVDITADVKSVVSNRNVANGVCFVFVPHTTAAITINENADPDVKVDFIKGINAIGLDDLTYKHLEGNSPAHIKASITGTSVTVFIQNSQLLLGTWQGIYFCEYDGPRARTVYVKMLEG